MARAFINRGSMVRPRFVNFYGSANFAQDSAACGMQLYITGKTLSTAAVKTETYDGTIRAARDRFSIHVGGGRLPAPFNHVLITATVPKAARRLVSTRPSTLAIYRRIFARGVWLALRRERNYLPVANFTLFFAEFYDPYSRIPVMAAVRSDPPASSGKHRSPQIEWIKWPLSVAGTCAEIEAVGRMTGGGWGRGAIFEGVHGEGGKGDPTVVSVIKCSLHNQRYRSPPFHEGLIGAIKDSNSSQWRRPPAGIAPTEFWSSTVYRTRYATRNTFKLDKQLQFQYTFLKVGIDLTNRKSCVSHRKATKSKEKHRFFRRTCGQTRCSKSESATGAGFLCISGQFELVNEASRDVSDAMDLA
ncbi:hypothetical protein Bbelb_007690 [Branchiostoma belcheri]|nr:hypothetical protein Bbelb_007690 [Branchiostoma belcheri]